MDTKVNELRRLEVDDIDDEVYYREIQGCNTKMDGSGDYAIVNCGQGEVRSCQNPASTDRRVAQEASCGSYGCEGEC
jgi:hypothetical protein